MLRRAYCTRQERRAGKIEEMLTSPALYMDNLHETHVRRGGCVRSLQAGRLPGRLGTSHYKSHLTPDKPKHKHVGLRLSGTLSCASQL